MAHLITFATGKFDISKERPNDINPVAREGVLKCIQDHLAGTGFTSTEPSTEGLGLVHGCRGSRCVLSGRSQRRA
jgi:hypothetical protein